MLSAQMNKQSDLFDRVGAIQPGNRQIDLEQIIEEKEKMPDYRVAISIEGGLVLNVQANSPEEAEKKAHDIADWGADVCIDGETTETIHRDWQIVEVEEV